MGRPPRAPTGARTNSLAFLLAAVRNSNRLTPAAAGSHLQYSATFIKHAVELESLHHLDESHLAEMGKSTRSVHIHLARHPCVRRNLYRRRVCMRPIMKVLSGLTGADIPIGARMKILHAIDDYRARASRHPPRPSQGPSAADGRADHPPMTNTVAS